MIRQQHALKFGFELRPIRIYTGRGRHHPPSRHRAPGQHALFDQVLGGTSAPDPFNSGATSNRFLKQYRDLYAQDEWKIRKNLTMSYGCVTVLRRDA